MRTITILLCGLCFSSCVAVMDDWGEPPRYTSFESSEDVGDETRLDARVELNIGKLEVQPGEASDAYRLELYYNENALSPRVDFRREGEAARLRFELSGKGQRFSPRHDKTRLNLRFSPETALNLEAQTGIGESEIDLSGMNIAGLKLATGVGETNLAMLSPNRGECETLTVKNGVGSLEVKGLGNFGFRRLEFQGGVGSAQLDFSGAWERIGDIEIKVGVGRVEILLPRSLGAEIRASKNFLSSLDLSDFTREGDVYISNNRERVDKTLRLRIDSGIGGVEIRWI